MRFPFLTGVTAWTCLLQSTNAFAPPGASYRCRAALSPCATNNADVECAATCDIASDFDNTPSLVNVPNGANAIRSGVVTNYLGDFVRLDDVISKDKPHQQLVENGIKGPTFVSIGDAEKLNTFLDANPFMNKEQMFVDDYSFDAYKAAGFTRFDQVDKEKAQSVKMTAPNLKFSEWINYFRTVGKVSPVPKDMKFGEIPEGVLWTGGTFVVQGNKVLYQWTDTVPGNHPVVEDVIKMAKEASLSSNKSDSTRMTKFSSWF
ncbi:hypothetical protein HJC23_007274 [Cyclotella cryptica]|uniref:Uncharacterized protein n=1 Tax=Cyclotella cryptica TaxID=29204 RepID=A0ABD3Q0T9_9STRA